VKPLGIRMLGIALPMLHFQANLLFLYPYVNTRSGATGRPGTLNISCTAWW